MLLAAPLIALVLAAPAGKKAPVPTPAPAATVQLNRFELGQKLFNEGDIDGALRNLELAIAETSEAGKLEKIQLLRAQAFAARQEFAHAEEAFAMALEANPETALDPSRVDPTVVRLLESVRARMQGSITVNSTPIGAHIRLGGKPTGDAPTALNVPAGRHTIGAQWDDGPTTVIDVQVRPRREVHIEFVRPPPTVISEGAKPDERPLRPFGELRGSGELSTVPTIRGGLDLGGGFELSYFRVGLWVRMYPYFALTPRFQFALPVVNTEKVQVNVVLEAGVPVPIFPDLGVGLHGQGGVEVYPVRWFAAFAMIGARHMFLWRAHNDPTAFTATAGIRLRVP